MPEKLKEFINKMNEKGIPIILLKDPKTGCGSVSLTLVFLSSLYVQAGLLGSVAATFKGIDIQQALFWHYATLGLYFGRNVSSNGKSVEISSTKSDQPEV